MFEVIGVALVLAVIVWVIYRYYPAPESEYLNVLNTLPVNDFAHLDIDVIKERIEEAQQILEEIDAYFARTKKSKIKKSYRFEHHLERIKLALLSYELNKRECDKEN